MSIEIALDADPNVCQPDEMVKCWDERMARWISDVLCPPVVAALSIVTVAAYLATPAAWKWAALFLALAVAAPTLYVIWLLYRGEVTDFHLRVREQRIRPMIVIVTTTSGAWLMLIVRHAPSLLVDVATAGMAITLILLLVTLRWKISGHTTAISSFVVLCCLLIGPAAAPMILSVPLVTWARVRLRRHTLAQTIAGAALGTLTSLALSLAHPGR
jgi:hypothetical protein